MHRIVAQSPTTQARLFLLMEEIILTEVLGVEEAFIGRYRIDDPQMPRRLNLAKEDHLASNSANCLADFVEALLMPLEAQGRGFAHGHKKVISFAKLFERNFEAPLPERQCEAQDRTADNAFSNLGRCEHCPI